MFSFTGFIIACLAKAVEGYKEVQAIPNWRGRLIIFEDANVTTMMESEDESGKCNTTPYTNCEPEILPGNSLRNMRGTIKPGKNGKQPDVKMAAASSEFYKADNLLDDRQIYPQIYPVLYGFCSRNSWRDV